MNRPSDGKTDIISWLETHARLGLGPARAIRTYPPLDGVHSLVPSWARPFIGKDVEQISALFAWLQTEEAQEWLRRGDNLRELMQVLGELIG